MTAKAAVRWLASATGYQRATALWRVSGQRPDASPIAPSPFSRLSCCSKLERTLHVAQDFCCGVAGFALPILPAANAPEPAKSEAPKEGLAALLPADSITEHHLTTWAEHCLHRPCGHDHAAG